MESWQAVLANSAQSASLTCILASRTFLIFFKMQIKKGKNLAKEVMNKK